MELEHLVLGLPYLTCSQFMLYATLACFAICPLLIYLFFNLLKHLHFTLALTAFCYNFYD